MFKCHQKYRQTSSQTNFSHLDFRIYYLMPQTVRATDRIREMIEDKEDVVGIKVSVKRSKLLPILAPPHYYSFTLLSISLIAYYTINLLGGCNGYSYTMNYAKTEDLNSKKDEVVTSNDVTVLVDPKAIFYIAGTVMDFEVCLNCCPLDCMQHYNTWQSNRTFNCHLFKWKSERSILDLSFLFK